MGHSIPLLDMNPSFHIRTKIWSYKFMIVLKGFVRLIYRNPVLPINFVQNKIQLEKERDTTVQLLTGPLSNFSTRPLLCSLCKINLC